jgi:hypothetical protein
MVCHSILLDFITLLHATLNTNINCNLGSSEERDLPNNEQRHSKRWGGGIQFGTVRGAWPAGNMPSCQFL